MADWERLEFGHTWMKNRTSTFAVNVFSYLRYTKSSAVLSSCAVGLPDNWEIFILVLSGMLQGTMCFVTFASKYFHFMAIKNHILYRIRALEKRLNAYIQHYASSDENHLFMSLFYCFCQRLALSNSNLSCRYICIHGLRVFKIPSRNL